MIQKCTLCCKPLNENNKTNEHIIPNAIGGKRKTNTFICIVCNNRTGERWDSKLCEQLSHFSLLFQIRRERGTPSKQEFNTADGKKIRVLSDGSLENTKPTICEPVVTESGININISARNKKEANQIISGQVKSLKKKYPNIKNTNELQLNERRGYLDSPIVISKSYGGLTAGKSIVKSTLALLADSRIDPTICEHAIAFLLNDLNPCFGFYYDKDLIVNRPHGVPIHCVHVESNGQNGLIKGYVEYFGHVRYALLLSTKYYGKAFSSTYCINPLDGLSINVEVNITLTKQDFYDCYEYKKYDAEIMKSALDAIIQTMMERDFERQKQKEMKLAIEYACKKMGIDKDKELTEEKYKQFTEHLTEYILPFMMRNFHPSHIEK